MRLPSFKPRPPRWETIQQVVRIAIFTVATLLYGETWTDDPILSRVVPGAAYAFALIWWGVWEITRPSSEGPVVLAESVAKAESPKPEAPEEGTTTTVTTTTEATPVDESPVPKPKKESEK